MTLSPPRLVAWEITRSCNLYCAHCRASAKQGPYPGELSTQECCRLVDGILEVGNPILILTGGEPLLRPDLFDIAGYAAGKGVRVTVGTNGTLLDDATAARLKAVPISRIGVSLDFPSRSLQDDFRGLPGAFDAALRGIESARRAGLEVQINSTITKLNASYLGDLLTLALELGAVAFHPFMLVPTGRGKELEDQELPPEEYERILNWIYDRQAELGDRIFFKPTDAPHYMRVFMQRGKSGHGAAMPPTHHGAGGHPGGRPGMNAISRGCLAGIGFCFISHVGRVQGCGYLDVEAGNIKRQSFADVWRDSPLFNQLRDYSLLRGKCGVCEFKKVCGGCRARAFEATGDCLEAEPYCVYQPRGVASPHHGHSPSVIPAEAGIQGQEPSGT
ncbi:MAG: radical SAM protein [Dehalococcoidia bacterium]|nr:radical SAM protein [Dehalococcoidia bacterium]